MSLHKQLGITDSLLEAVKKIQQEETEYQAKVRAHMAKKGIKSLGDLSPEEKKKFFNDLDAAHKAQNESGEMGATPKGKEKPVMMRHKTSGKEISVTPSGVKEKEKLGFVVVKEEKHPEDVKTSANKMEPEGTKKWLATHATHLKYLKQVKKDKLQEAEGGGTSVSGIKADAQGALKRAELLKKSAEMRLKHAQERDSLSKQKKALSTEHVEFVDESFTDAQLAKLRAEYGKINTIDPSGDSYKKLTAMLDKMDKPTLTKIAGANIKFMSGLAKNRVNRMKNEEVDEACWDTHKQEGMKKKGDKMVPNCVPKEAANPAQQAAIAIAMKKAGKKPKNEEVELEEMDKSQPSSSRGAEGLPVGKRATPSTTDKTKKDALKVLQQKYKKVKEETELEEGKSGTGYELYHKDFSSAMAHAYDFAKKKYNIEIDPFEIDRNVAMGPKKPSSGKANAYRLLDKTGKKAIQVQVTNLDNKRYELNMYKEEVEEIDEKVVKGKGYDNPENERKGPEGKVPMTSLMPGHSDKAARFAAVQAKGRLVKGKAQSAPQKEAADAPEFKQGGDKLAKKFEKAFAKMGLKTNIKMKTVGNVSINEKEEAKKDKEAPAKQKSVKKGETLSGKQEPIKIDPEISDK